MGASRLSLIGEVGANYIGGMSNSGPKFGRDSLFGQSPWQPGAAQPVAEAPPFQGTVADRPPHAPTWCEATGSSPTSSWAYRLLPALTSTTLFAGTTLT